jgi:hypothetical protein
VDVRWARSWRRSSHRPSWWPAGATTATRAACRRLAHTVAGYYAVGGFVRGGGWRIAVRYQVGLLADGSSFSVVLRTLGG